jgi:hypothetical protein
VVFGPRFLIQAGFIIAVAVIAGIADVGTWSIIGLVAGAWIVVALVEIGLWVRHATTRRAAPEPLPPPPVVVRAEPVPTPEPPLIAAAPPPPEPEPETRGLTPVGSDPSLAPEPEPVVTHLPVTQEPREWNLWELERAVREHGGDDVAQNEERAYLLVYLREFAGPDGMLPADFDGLVRDAFGDLLAAVVT